MLRDADRAHERDYDGPTRRSRRGHSNDGACSCAECEPPTCEVASGCREPAVAQIWAPEMRAHLGACSGHLHCVDCHERLDDSVVGLTRRCPACIGAAAAVQAEEQRIEERERAAWDRDTAAAESLP